METRQKVMLVVAAAAAFACLVFMLWQSCGGSIGGALEEPDSGSVATEQTATASSSQDGGGAAVEQTSTESSSEEATSMENVSETPSSAASEQRPATIEAADIGNWGWLSGKLSKSRRADLLEALQWYFGTGNGHEVGGDVSLSVVSHRDSLEGKGGKARYWNYYLLCGSDGNYYRAHLEDGVWDVSELTWQVPGVNVSEEEYEKMVNSQDDGE